MKKKAPRSDIVVVFVPGGMGSKLAVGRDLVWSDGTQAFSSLKMIGNPSMLLPWTQLNCPGVLSFYDSFISFLDTRGYSVGKGNLVVWPYDWRISIEDTGNQLNNYINQKFRKEFRDKKIIFICHSLGCLVVRWAVLQSLPDIRSSVERVIAAAPPGLGIAAAFREMVEVTFGSTWLYAWALALTKLFCGYDIDIPLIGATKAITSLLELLPPNFLPILTTGSGSHIGVFNWQRWPDELSSLRAQVQARQASPGRPWSQIHRTLIASNQHPTEASYRLNSDDSAILSALSENGDGSVTYTSARAYLDLTVYQPIPPQDTEVLVASEHEGLLGERAARAEIARLI